MSRVERVELVVTTEDPEIAELCRLYWAVDADGEYLHTVKELTERYGLRSGQVNQLVRQNSNAFTLEPRCPRCGDGFPVQSRSDLAASAHRFPASCSGCQSELAAIRQRETVAIEATRRAAIQANFPVENDELIAVKELDLRSAVALASLLRDGENANDGIITPLSMRSQRLAPTHSLSIELARSVFEEGLIGIHSSSPPKAFEWGEDSQPVRFFIDKVTYYVSGSGPLAGRVVRAEAEFESICSFEDWPSEWVTEMPVLWMEVAVAECVSYLLFCLSQHGLDFSPGEQTLATMRKGLGWFSIGQMFNFIWRAARDASAYRSRERVSKSQAANSAITRLRTGIERAYAEGWSIKPYGRDTRLPISTISHLLFSVCLKLADPLAFNPLADSSRSPVALRWSNLTAEGFERLMFALASEAEGYAEVDWLMKTTAPDHGRDIGAVRLRNDSLSGYTQERVVIQCKHWLSRSIKAEDISGEVTSIDHWEHPPVDVLIFATSGRFTVDAVSWVERHNAKGTRPRVEMWNDAKLESLLSDRPHLVLAFELR